MDSKFVKIDYSDYKKFRSIIESSGIDFYTKLWEGFLSYFLSWRSKMGLKVSLFTFVVMIWVFLNVAAGCAISRATISLSSICPPIAFFLAVIFMYIEFLIMFFVNRKIKYMEFIYDWMGI